MKEYIIDFELYEDGKVIKYLQKAWEYIESDIDKIGSPFNYFTDYAKEYCRVDGGVRITNIWVVEV